MLQSASRGSVSRTIPLRKVRVFTSVKRLSSTSPEKQETKPEPESKDVATNAMKKSEQKPAKKTMAQLDEEMKRAMSGLAGDGGEAGLELEDGKAVSMKRGVRENMFRYI